MVDEEGKKKDKFDFTPEGEAPGYISLEQARLLAMRTARDNPGNYGRALEGVRMVFDVVEQEEGEDYYVVTMSFRPEGDFAGTPGQEQFFIEKEGVVADRQVRSLPRITAARRFPIFPVAIGLVVAVAVVVGVAFAAGVFKGKEEVEVPIVILVPTVTPSPTPTATVTAAPIVVDESRRSTCAS